jgi:4-hydroxybenzoate polyprenyltransferase
MISLRVNMKKKIIKLVAEEFLFGAHLVSLGASGIVLSVVMIFNLPIQPLLLLIAYLILQIIYRYNYFRELHFDMQSNPERVTYISAKKKWIEISPFLFLAILCGLLLFTNLLTALLAGYITGVGILYTEYFKKLPILGIKNYYTSHFWAILVLMVPFFYDLANIPPYLYIVLFIFIRGLINTVFFDLKDIEDDKKRNVKTFPVRWGKRKTLYILQIINFLSIAPLLLGVYTGQLPGVSLFLGATVLLGVFYLKKAMHMTDKSLRLLSYILVDGEYMFWPVVILIGKLFF